MIIWRRHVLPCESTDRSDPRCGCPIYQEYRVNGKRFRRTLKTRNWQKALADARKKELEDFKEERSITIEQAANKYLEDAKARHLQDPTIAKLRLLFRQLGEFAFKRGLVFVSDLNLDNQRDFRAAWPNRNESARVKLGNLKSFCRFCHEAGWIAENPAAKLKAGKVLEPKIEPLTQAEFTQIVNACATSKEKNATRLMAIILLMRFTGLRIRDAVTLRRDSIQGDELFLRTTKTGQSEFIPLPPGVLEAFGRIPVDKRYEKHFFWTGASKPKTAVGHYQAALQQIFKKAGVPRAYPHIFRHTFATQLLADGRSLETVATLLGNTTRIVAKHYSHWIKARQEALRDEVKKSWAQLGTMGTQATDNR
jgi:integrase/recombinase XerD